MSGYRGQDAWAGYHPDPVTFHKARHTGYNRVRGQEDDPLRAMHETLAIWEGTALPKLKHPKRKVRTWRIRGLLALKRPLTPEEDRELDNLIAKHTVAKVKRRVKKANASKKSNTDSNTKRKAQS